MTTFKEYIFEATIEDLQNKGFGTPGDRAKFQDGDYVVIFSDNRWDIYQSQRSGKYIGQVGKVVGYKYMPGSYSKYAVEFSDKNVEAFHAHYILGPFADAAIAKKYSSANVKAKSSLVVGHKVFAPKVDIADLKNYSGGTLKTNPKYESKLLEILTKEPFNLQIPNKPLSFRGGSNSQYVATILAYKPFNSHGIKFEKNKHTREGKVHDRNDKFKDFITKNIALYRLNNSINGNFVSDVHPSSTSLNKDYNYTNTPYYLAIPYVNFSDLDYSDVPVDFFDKDFVKKQVEGNKKHNRGFIEIKDISLPQRILKDVDKLAQALKRFDDLASGNFDAQEMFDSHYAITEKDGKRYLNTDARVDENSLKYFYDLHTLEGKNVYQDVWLHIYTTDPSRLKGKVPPNITKLNFVTPGYNRHSGYHGSLKNKLTTINDCTFLDKSNAVHLEFDGCDVKSLNGVPSTAKFVHFNYSIINNLVGLPNRLNVLSFQKCEVKSFEGGSNIVTNTLDSYDSVLKDMNSLSEIPESRSGYESTRFDNVKSEQIKKVVKDRKFLKTLKSGTQDAFGDIFTSI
jgi:hypothetical protein